MKKRLLKENNDLIGKRVRLIRMEDDPDPIKPGTEGTVRHIDGAGVIHVNWDNGRKLGLIPNEDEYEIIEETLNEVGGYDDPYVMGRHSNEYTDKIMKGLDIMGDGAEIMMGTLNMITDDNLRNTVGDCLETIFSCLSKINDSLTNNNDDMINKLDKWNDDEV